ncbi:uncharacterized protein LOC131326693 [Rhododendron vialii]|uniref:uncharacterized protein LOC131326693 n=1 Tax=Rhododendron vialii TaxID=182163 RepID=UPI00265EC5C3|nr:uncharacterized protein LOC131326693 [Rhododendron vialii]
MKLKKKQEQEKLVKPIPNELDYAEELDKAPSIPVKEKNGRAIETIEEAKGIVSFGEDTYLLFELIGNYIKLRDMTRLRVVCRVVCRVWNEVFSQKEVYGMFVQTGNLISFFSLKNYFSIFPDPLGFIHDKHFEGEDMVLVSSCQGILCFRTTSGYIIGNHHSEYLALPAQTINHGKKKVVAILCHELGDGDFKLAIAFATESLNLAFEVYAEGRWFTIVSSIKGPHLLYLRRDGLYHNGSAYFLSEWGCIYKFDLATRASSLLRCNALRSDILGVFHNRVCTFRFDRVAAGCELVVASVKENEVKYSLKLDWARLKLLPSGCRILACTKDQNIIIAIGMKIFWYKIHSRVLEPIGSLPEHDKANFVAYSCYDVNEILRF